MTQGIEAYLPLWRPPSRRGAAVARPFFRGYLFAHADLDVVGLSALEYLPGVRRLLYCGDRPATVPPEAIERIRARLREMETSPTDGLGQVLAHGDRVMITGGPLAGLDAVFDSRLSSGERVRVLINFLQNGTRVEIDRQFVHKSPQSNIWLREGRRPRR